MRLRVGNRELRRRLAGDGVDHPARLHLAAIGPARKRGHAVLHGERIDVGPVHQKVGFNLLVRQAGVAGICSTGAAQRAHIEHAQTFFISADDTIIKAVELVAGGIDRSLDQLHLGRIDPAAVPLQLREFCPHEIAAGVIGDRHGADDAVEIGREALRHHQGFTPAFRAAVKIGFGGRAIIKIPVARVVDQEIASTRSSIPLWATPLGSYPLPKSL